MDTAKSRRSRPPVASADIPHSPRLWRTTSGSAAASPPQIHFLSPKSSKLSENRPSKSAATSPRPSIDRAKATVKTNSKDKDDDDKTAKHARSSPRYNVIKRVNRSSSASAWALSPGRQHSPCPLPESPKLKAVTGGSGGVGGVLKYFIKQKAASLVVQDEELYQCRVMHNRLLQWRFANARAEAAMAAVKIKAEEKLLSIWLSIYQTRYAIAAKRIKVERLRRKIKLLEIVCPQIELLNYWEKLEKRNCEAVGRVTRKLSAISAKLPLVQGAKVDMVSLRDALSQAMEAMDDIEATVTKFYLQADTACYLLKELVHAIGKHRECFRELDNAAALLTSLEALEKSLRAYLMQENMGRTQRGRRLLQTTSHELIWKQRNNSLHDKEAY
ncbi:hypothetical protein Nepgr_029895 [Nepenthes gracilis]|uniref:QWRF motif-containing protein 7 n=1 Tax=Nepenthes gracilis TaxID=150966 RepID=A0AAD3TG62_NEPGR|nr:hypothetical protein Nepgr_029895 [Nepenthes gracilis]